MINKYTIASCALLTLVSLQSWAVPTRCPAIPAIMNAGLMTAEKDIADGLYVAGQINNYGTPETWAFVIAIPLSGASSEADALNKARFALTGLSGSPTPIAYGGRWICAFNDFPNGYKALAVTPATFNGMKSFSAVKG